MSEIKVDTVAEKTSANGVTIDGLSIKDSKLVTANSVITSNVTDANVTYGKIQNVSATNRILGRDSANAGIIEEITPANLRTMLNVADGATVGGTNTPAFLAYANADQGSISANSNTKLTNYGAEVFDTDNKFASSRFTPGVVGKYFIYGTVYGNGTNGSRNFFYIYVNGSNYQTSGYIPGSSSNFPQQVVGIVNVTNTSDYIELYFNSTGGTGTAYASGVQVKFGGYKLI